jgi:hypothetical protein
VGTATAALALSVACAPASADSLFNHTTFEVDPTFFANGSSDAQAPAVPGTVPVGYTNDHPIPNDIRLNYGMTVAFDKQWSFYYNHSNLDFALGRIINPPVSLVTGDIQDRVDTVGLNFAATHFLSTRFYYFDHEREDVTGLCLNQTICAPGVHNPAAIDEHGYAVGATWSFGPRSLIGPIFSVAADAKYVPRGFPPPAGYSLNGLGAYTGSQFEYPYSVNMKLPTHHDPTLIWLAGYERATALFRAESSIEQYNVTSFGVVKVLSPRITVSAVDLNFKGCRCADTVTPPDNVRLDTILLTLSYKFTPHDLYPF